MRAWLPVPWMTQSECGWSARVRGEHSLAFCWALSTHPHPTPNRHCLLHQGFHRHRPPPLQNEHVPHSDAELGSGVQRSASWRKAAGGWGSEGLGLGVWGGPLEVPLQSSVCLQNGSHCILPPPWRTHQKHKGRCEWKTGVGREGWGRGERFQ